MPHRLLLNGTDALLLNGVDKLALDATPQLVINHTVPAFTEVETIIHPPNSVVFSQTINPFPVTTGPIANFVTSLGRKAPRGLMLTGGRPRRAL